ncbi:hypothetical protein BGZ70_009718 [Mortierella alpina]|uniref:Eisosome component PIL1-domain-containing protein n=1 Tax=Mortierella alpina TaxID=64518 RepID=A0A9P6JG88_MORAP|nr:hypothetical protein BGZ70_009718 [Mortierella alpina]
MDLLNIRSHFQEGARMAAGSFLSPLTNAIGEQRKLVESLAVVSKVRVDECKHMMTWSKSQTEDLGDVLLKLNLLIRKISDYEIKFGSQYEQFREKVKYLRTKDDTLCEMGRRQTDLQTKIVESSKNRLRTAKALLKPKELEEIQKETEPDATKLQHLKRQLIKDAYTLQLNAIIELGKKMQIIGEHGNQLLEHIDLTCSATSYNDGRETEDILQAARIALENWDQLVKADAHAVIVHPPPAVSVSDVSAGHSDVDDRDATEEQTSETISPPSSSKVNSTAAIPTDVPPLPPRSSNNDRQCDEDLVESEEEALRRREELEMKQALELSLAMSASVSSSSVGHGKDIGDLNLSAEELRFVMGEVTEAAALKKALTVAKKQVDIAADDEDVEHDIVAPKVTSAPRIVRSPQVVESVGNVMSQQGPRPWVPEEQEVAHKKAVEDTPATAAHEELASSSANLETMGESATSEALSTNSVSTSQHKAMESMGAEPEHPLESMGSEPVALESMGQDGHSSAETVSFVPTPQVPSLDGIREQKLLTKQQQQQQAPPLSPPSTTYVPQASKQKNRLSGSHVMPPSRDGATSPAYQIQLQYQQQQQQQQQQMYQQQYQQQQAYQLSYQRGSQSQCTNQYQQPLHTSVQQQQQYQKQQQKQLHDFYYTPSEQEYQQQYQQRFQQQQQHSNTGQSQRSALNYWSYPDLDQQYSDTTSPSPSHISLIPDNSTSPTISSAGGPASDHAYKVEL